MRTNLIICLNNFKMYKSEREAAVAFNVAPSTITRILNKQIKSKDNLCFVRAEDVLDFSAENPFDSYNNWVIKQKKLLARKAELELELAKIEAELGRGL